MDLSSITISLFQHHTILSDLLRPQRLALLPLPGLSTSPNDLSSIRCFGALSVYHQQGDLFYSRGHKAQSRHNITSRPSYTLFHLS